jgi:hypothetical protein
MASGQPAPALDPVILGQGISEASGGSNPVDEPCDDWLDAARAHGIDVDSENGGIVLDTIIPVITAAFWPGLTNGHFAITREYSTPRRFLPCFEGAAAGGRGYRQGGGMGQQRSELAPGAFGGAATGLGTAHSTRPRGPVP